MSKIRGHGKLFDGTVADNDKSSVVSVGPASDVAVFIENTGGQPIDFTVVCAGNTGLSAGRNAVPDDPALMFEYLERDNSAVLKLVVPAGARRCFDLSPFAPQFLALIATAAGGPSTIKASVTTNG